MRFLLQRIGDRQPQDCGADPRDGVRRRPRSSGCAAAPATLSPAQPVARRAKPASAGLDDAVAADTLDLSLVTSMPALRRPVMAARVVCGSQPVASIISSRPAPPSRLSRPLFMAATNASFAAEVEWNLGVSQDIADSQISDSMGSSATPEISIGLSMVTRMGRASSGRSDAAVINRSGKNHCSQLYGVIGFLRAHGHSCAWEWPKCSSTFNPPARYRWRRSA
jgi:hypothetical protein